MIVIYAFLSNTRAPESDPGSRIPLSKDIGISLKSGRAMMASPTHIHKYFKGKIDFSIDG
jgi:hypothetical protein